MVSKNTKGKIIAAVTGSVVGAGAVVAGAMALSDKGNRKKVDEALSRTKHLFKTYAGKSLGSAINKAKLVRDKIDKV